VHICGIREFSAEIDVENIIQAPAYPGDYGNIMNCWYTITSPENTRIRFWIDDFGTKKFYRRIAYNNIWQYEMLVSIRIRVQSPSKNKKVAFNKLNQYRNLQEYSLFSVILA